MKHFVLAFALLTITASAFARPPPEMQQYREECQAEIGITTPPRHGDDDNNDPKVKCFHACLMKKMGNLVDGKISLEKELENLSKRMPTADDSIKAKLTECVTQANAQSDECEAAYSMKKCLRDSGFFFNHHGRPKQD